MFAFLPAQLWYDCMRFSLQFDEDAMWSLMVKSYWALANNAAGRWCVLTVSCVLLFSG